MNREKEFTEAPTFSKLRRIGPHELDVEAKSEETVDNELDTAEPQELHQRVNIRTRIAELTDEEWKAFQISQLDDLIAYNKRHVIDQALLKHRIKSKEFVSGILASLSAVVQSGKQAGIKVSFRRLDGLFSDGWRHIASFLEKKDYQALSRCSRGIYPALMPKKSIAKLTLDRNHLKIAGAERSALLSHYPHITSLCLDTILNPNISETLGEFSSRLKQLELISSFPIDIRDIIEMLQSPEYEQIEALILLRFQENDIDLSGTKLKTVSIRNPGNLSLPSSIRRVSLQFEDDLIPLHFEDVAAKCIAAAFAVPEIEFFEVDLSLTGEDPFVIMALIQKALHTPRKSSSMCISVTLGRDQFCTAYCIALQFVRVFLKCANIDDWRIKVVVKVSNVDYEGNLVGPDEESRGRGTRSELDSDLDGLRPHYLVHWEWSDYLDDKYWSKLNLMVSNKDCKICGCVL